MINASIALFKALPIKDKGKKNPTEKSILKTLKYGFIFSPEVYCNYTEKELDNIVSVIHEELGPTSEQINNAFHKSWQKIQNAKIEQLVMEQLVHYFTTYGFQELGIYNENSVYVPSEKLEVPEFAAEDINLTVIKGYSEAELKGKLLELLYSGIALQEKTIIHVVTIAESLDLSFEEINLVKNKEVKMILFDSFDLFPEDPIEFLRYTIFKCINKSLLIKDDATIDELKEKVNRDIFTIFVKYDSLFGFARLAEIFYRYKPIFLAYRSYREFRPVINKIRKLAIRHHKPMPEDYLNSITAKLKKGEAIDLDTLQKELNKVNTFRKIRLAYALKFRTKNVDSILYKIRNGKAFATDFIFQNHEGAKKILSIVTDSIIQDIRKKVEGKRIFIPDYITYALPATEKQFTGNFPSGTFITVPDNMIFGIHWENTDNNRIDLDLSLVNINIGKIGWDGQYKSQENKILFSGDMTDAPLPNGASELFYIRKQMKDSFLMYTNFYNYIPDLDVTYKIVVAKDSPKNFKSNYIVDPTKVIATAKSIINKRQKILGLVIVTTNNSRFYFTETVLGGSITSTTTEFGEHSRKYLTDFFTNMITLNTILQKSGAILVDDNNDCDIDLTPENIDKNTIINLIG